MEEWKAKMKTVLIVLKKLAYRNSILVLQFDHYGSDYPIYYFYEVGRDDQHVALVAAVNSGKAIIAGATAPQSKWDDDGMKLRSAANIDVCLFVH
ncbi:hypothetical protein L484_006225 [Morus notabilis]|uniref:Uncharacterized protein n=1 Tax=Morus notabilis TaxID=981085 RepID=W9RHH6_9ROSA|nr:hypothetical protein L484_006225 [Morus notabilis]